MKGFQKTYLLLILILIIPSPVLGFLASGVTNHQAPTAYFYPQEFDKLVMDLTLSSGKKGQTDLLKALTLKNIGTARDLNEIEKIKLWKDKGKIGFQGMGIDKELGKFTFYSPSNSWYIENLNEPIFTEGLRIFISLETSRNPTNNTSLQMKIPVLSDSNNNGTFDLGDEGIFLESQNNGPIDGNITNAYSQAIYARSYDELAPKTVIIAPEDNSTISTKSYTIEGMARDQGGSSPRWVKLGINDTWYDVTATSSNYETWKYEWTGIEEGVYTFKTKSADWLGNKEVAGEGVKVTVAFPVLEEKPEEVSEGEVPEEAEKPIAEINAEELKLKIVEIQKQIIELLEQLIQLIQEQINQLQR